MTSSIPMYRGLACDVVHDMMSPMVTAMLRHAGRFIGNNVRKRPKIGHFSGPIETF
jgi:hypothetical protein